MYIIYISTFYIYSAPFIARYGLTSLVLPSYSYFIIYAYDNLYTIDIDIKVSISRCEGILDIDQVCMLDPHTGTPPGDIQRWVPNLTKFVRYFTLQCAQSTPTTQEGGYHCTTNIILWVNEGHCIVYQSIWLNLRLPYCLRIQGDGHATYHSKDNQQFGTQVR